MNNKSENLYSDKFEYLESILQINTRENIENITITIDFEKSELNAIKKIFPKIRIIECWFHFKKNIVKNAKKGLYTKKFCEQTKTIIRKIGIWPLKYHKEKSKMIYDELEEFNKNSICNEFTNYIKNEWIQFFENGMLNYYNLNKKLRTNNSIEN